LFAVDAVKIPFVIDPGPRDVSRLGIVEASGGQNVSAEILRMDRQRQKRCQRCGDEGHAPKCLEKTLKFFCR